MLVSVWMSAYNHEPFIARAIDSVLMQQTNFDVEIIIGEDYSTDQTRKIILDYHKKFPGKFKLLLPDYNLGMIPMFRESYPLCTGKYVAWLDGDDYWTDPFKLHKQVEFLETHPDFVMCFHNFSVLDQINNEFYEKGRPQYANPDGSLSASHFCYYNPVATCSVVYRNILPKELPGWFYKLAFLDLAFYFLLVEKGRIQYLDDNMCVYRIHKEGEWSGKNKYARFLQLWQFYEQLDSYLEGRYKKFIKKNATWYLNELLDASVTENEYKTARKCFKHILLYDTVYIIRNGRKYLKYLFSLYL